MNNIFKALRESNHQSRAVYTATLSHTRAGVMKTFSDKQNFLTDRSLVKDEIKPGRKNWDKGQTGKQNMHMSESQKELTWNNSNLLGYKSMINLNIEICRYVASGGDSELNCSKVPLVC